jgi:hypothetical protein
MAVETVCISSKQAQQPVLVPGDLLWHVALLALGLPSSYQHRAIKPVFRGAGRLAIIHCFSSYLFISQGMYYIHCPQRGHAMSDAAALGQ